MSQDGKTFNLRNIDGQTVGIVTIALGFALLIAFYVVRESIYLMIPVIMLEIGIYGMALGAFSYLRGPRTSGRWGNDSVYSLFGKHDRAVIGGMWIAYDRLATHTPPHSSPRSDLLRRHHADKTGTRLKSRSGRKPLASGRPISVTLPEAAWTIKGAAWLNPLQPHAAVEAPYPLALASPLRQNPSG